METVTVRVWRGQQDGALQPFRVRRARSFAPRPAADGAVPEALALAPPATAQRRAAVPAQQVIQ